MKLRDVMTRDVKVARPGDDLQAVAKILAEENVGSAPVCDGQRLLGMITDRDIVIRAVAQGRDGTTPVTEVMTADVEYCFEDDDLEEVSEKMAAKQIRRLPVVDRDKKLVGIVALGDLALCDKDMRTGDTLEKISQPGGSA